MDSLRYTPAGIPVLNFKIQHESEQIEAGFKRSVQCEIPALAMAQTAQLISAVKLGEQLKLEGFLVAKSLKRAQAVLHVNQVEFRGKSI